MTPESIALFWQKVDKSGECGHAMSGDNLSHSSGRRVCKACKRDTARRIAANARRALLESEQANT